MTSRCRWARLPTINTHAGNGGAEVDCDVVNGLFHSLTAAICQTRLRHMDSVGMRLRVNGCLRSRLRVRRVTTPDGEIAETADHLLAYFAFLLPAEPKAADRLLRNDNGLQWSKAHAPRRLRGLVCRIFEAHRPEGEVWNEQEPGEELLNGRDVSEDEVADSGDGVRDLTDDDDPGGGGSTRNGGRDGDFVFDDQPHGGGQRRGRGGGRVGGDGGHVGTNDDAAGDVVADNGRHGGGERHGRCGGHIGVDEGLLHGSDAGDAGGHARGHGAGANDDAAADVVVHDRRQDGGQRQGRGGGHVGVNGGHVHASHAGVRSGRSLGHVVGAIDEVAADVVVDDGPHGDGQRQRRGGGRVGHDGGLVGLVPNDDAAADVVPDVGRHDRGQGHGRGGGNVRVDGGHVHGSRAGDTDGDGVVDHQPLRGRQQRGRGGGHVGVDGRLVHPRHALDTGGHP